MATAGDVPSVAGRWREAVIERIERRTPRVVSVFLRATGVPHVAGQHLDIRLTAPDGYQAERSYSIASAPGAADLELAIELLAEGEVSPYFHASAAPGDKIEIRGPIGGHFIWRPQDGGPLLLLAGGSGIVPLMSMLRYRAATTRQVRALLVYSVRSWDDIIYRDEILVEETGDPNFTFIAATTREPPRRIGDIGRRLDRALLRDTLARWGRAPRHVYVCGANGFVEAVTGALVEEQMLPSIIRTERYGGPG